jgi:hypothetical protein
MRAQPGDFLLVEGPTEHSHTRRGEILAVHGDKGGPPFMVRWQDSGHEALVFPGPDAHVEATEVPGAGSA